MLSPLFSSLLRCFLRRITPPPRGRFRLFSADMFYAGIRRAAYVISFLRAPRMPIHTPLFTFRYAMPCFHAAAFRLLASRQRRQ